MDFDLSHSVYIKITQNGLSTQMQNQKEKKKHLRENENLGDIGGSYCVSDTKTHSPPCKDSGSEGHPAGM